MPDELTPRLTPTLAGWAATALADPAALRRWEEVEASAIAAAPARSAVH